jgi:hypothetical protein
MVAWIKINPNIRSYWANDLLAKKFPESTPTIRFNALRLTRVERKAANAAASRDLHAKMVAYLQEHPTRYVAWLLHDFPEATICQANRAILKVHGALKRYSHRGDAPRRDYSCPSGMKELLAGRKERQMQTAMEKLMATTVPSEST